MDDVGRGIRVVGKTPSQEGAKSDEGFILVFGDVVRGDRVGEFEVGRVWVWKEAVRRDEEGKVWGWRCRRCGRVHG
jgi:hypothetical protein